MNKKQAAKFLRVSTRAIERYVAKGKLPVRYKKDDTGRQVALFEESQVKKIKTELENLAHPQPAAPPSNNGKTHPAPANGNGKVALRSAQLPTSTITAFADALAASLQKHLQPAGVPIPDKLTLSLSEASGLSGLSKGFLRVAIKAGELGAVKRGKGWNIKREDLNSYVQKL